MNNPVSVSTQNGPVFYLKILRYSRYTRCLTPDFGWAVCNRDLHWFQLVAFNLGRFVPCWWMLRLLQAVPQRCRVAISCREGACAWRWKRTERMDCGMITFLCLLLHAYSNPYLDKAFSFFESDYNRCLYNFRTITKPVMNPCVGPYLQKSALLYRFLSPDLPRDRCHYTCRWLNSH